MKTKLCIVAAVFASAGMLIGGSVMTWLHRPDHFGPQYTGMLQAITAEHLLHAKLLREGRGAEALKLIESTFPSSVLHYDMFRLRGEDDLVQLWRIREYGEKYRIEYPQAVATLLANLPPKPASYCDIGAKPQTPNKAPEPTSGTVMPPAEPGVTPVPPVAHL